MSTYISFYGEKNKRGKLSLNLITKYPSFITVSVEDCYICNYTKPVSYALVICNHSPSSMGEGRHSGGKCDHFYLCVAPAVPRGGLILHQNSGNNTVPGSSPQSRVKQYRFNHLSVCPWTLLLAGICWKKGQSSPPSPPVGGHGYNDWCIKLTSILTFNSS